MDNQKITAYLPKNLLRRAQQATGKGITETLREGLELLSAREAGRHLREVSGPVLASLRVGPAVHLGPRAAPEQRAEQG